MGTRVRRMFSGTVITLAISMHMRAQVDTVQFALLDTSQYVVLVPDTDMNVFKQPTVAVATTPDMVNEAEKLLRQFHWLLLYADAATLDSIAATVSPMSTTMQFAKVPLDISFRQYASARTESGEILLYVNGLPNDDEDFPERRTEWVFVKDGGRKYFQARIDLTKRSIEYLWVNGR